MRKKVGASKRQTCAMKYKIKKRAAEHRRKVKKESRKARENNISTPNSKIKATKIPNSFPLKKQMITQRYFSNNNIEN